MISDGMKCESCLRELKEGEPVWRSNSFPPGMQSVCKNCVSRYCYDPNEWRPAKPCQHCGWPVALSVRRNVPKYVVCGETCRSAVYYAHRRHPLAMRACAICGERFQPKRAHALYCGSLCKQSADRKRALGSRQAAAPSRFRHVATGDRMLDDATL